MDPRFEGLKPVRSTAWFIVVAIATRRAKASGPMKVASVVLKEPQLGVLRTRRWNTAGRFAEGTRPPEILRLDTANSAVETSPFCATDSATPPAPARMQLAIRHSAANATATKRAWNWMPTTTAFPRSAQQARLPLRIFRAASATILAPSWWTASA